MTLPPDRPIYANSPIIEAIIDIRTVNAETLTVRELKKLGDSMPGYVQTAELFEIQQTLGEGSRVESNRRVGLAYRCEERRTTVQLHVSGFTCSRLAPYERWEPFSDHARDAWLQYVGVANPTITKRVAVRFVNRISVSQPITDFRPFVNVYPTTPWDLTSPPAGLFLQLRRLVRNDHLVVLNEAVVADENGETAIILDFDVFAESEQIFDSNVVWNRIEELHVTADAAFEESITDRVRNDIR